MSAKSKLGCYTELIRLLERGLEVADNKRMGKGSNEKAQHIAKHII
jgi:hypothetical protein